MNGECGKNHQKELETKIVDLEVSSGIIGNSVNSCSPLSNVTPGGGL